MSTKRHGIQVFTHADEGKTIPAISRAKLRWVAKGSTGGDDLLISDSDGNKVFESVTSSVQVIDQFDLDVKGVPIDLVLTTLDTGNLYIYEM
jgi:hypothetical protein